MIRCHYIFDSDEGGWIEEWFRDGDSLTGVLDEMSVVGRARSDLIGSGCRLEELQASVEGVNRDSVRREVDFGPPAVYAGSPMDRPWTAAKARVLAADARTRIFPLRGVPDSVVRRSRLVPISTVDGAWANRFETWATRVKDTHVIRALDKSGANPLLTITAVGLDVLGRPQITSPLHGLTAAYSRVRIVQINSFPSLNGEWEVHRIDANNLEIPSLNICTLLWFGGGFLRPLRYVAAPISSIQDAGIMRKKTGAGPSQTRGRNLVRY